MKKNIKKILLLLVCITFLGGKTQVRAKEFTSKNEIGIEFVEAYQDKNNDNKNDDNKQSDGGNEIKGESTSTATQPGAGKQALPQTGEKGKKESKAGTVLALLTMFVLGARKRLR